jgi:sigma-B regulation protein RsbU (phosphoserine phosphatase)
MADIVAVIREAFKDISPEEAAALCQVAQARTYPGGEVLIREGEVEHVFYIVADGQVAITQRLEPAGERLLALRQKGEFFGEMALIESKPRSATARTVAETTVLEINEEVFNDFLRASPNMALGMIRRITGNLRAADRAAIAELSQKNIELERAYEELKAAQAEVVAKERLERELEIAAEVQRSLLPDVFPPAPGYSFAGRNVPARHVGGDLYDVLALDDEHVGLLMADVSDKSVHAALIMAVTRTLFLAHARRSLSPGEVALAVHEGFLEVSTNDDMFVTVFYGVLHLPTGRLCYVRAGQDRPLHYRAEGGPPLELDAEGRFLGMLPGLRLEERTTELRPGDVLVMYSDGVPDAVNEARESYGVERLTGLVEQRRTDSAVSVCAAIFDDVFAFRGTAAAFDDITVLVARREEAA